MVEYRTCPLSPQQLIENASVLQEQDPSRIAGAVSIVGDHQDSGPQILVHCGHNLQQVLGRFGIQCSSRFICQQERLSRDDGSGAGGTLLLTSRNLIGEFAQYVRDPQFLSYAAHLPLDSVRVGVVEGKSQTDVFLDGQSIQQIEVLEHKPQPLPAEPGQFAVGQLRNTFSVQQDIPGADGINRRNAVQQGCFPAAGRAHDGDKFSVRHIKADAIQGLCHVIFASVVFFNIFYLQHITASFALPYDTAKEAFLVSKSY